MNSRAVVVCNIA